MTWLDQLLNAAFDVLELVVMVLGILGLTAWARLWWLRHRRMP